MTSTAPAYRSPSRSWMRDSRSVLVATVFPHITKPRTDPARATSLGSWRSASSPACRRHGYPAARKGCATFDLLTTGTPPPFFSDLPRQRRGGSEKNGTLRACGTPDRPVHAGVLPADTTTDSGRWNSGLSPLRWAAHTPAGDRAPGGRGRGRQCRAVRGDRGP